jgi:hypothetical protein
MLGFKYKESFACIAYFHSKWYKLSVDRDPHLTQQKNEFSMPISQSRSWAATSGVTQSFPKCAMLPLVRPNPHEPVVPKHTITRQLYLNKSMGSYVASPGHLSSAQLS